ncbi:MAG: hypothetical protein MZV64_09790 [Ignavibacteriales bacterium]|nr:hypothetical protein [Ignavibacteriales bacterium]
MPTRSNGRAWNSSASPQEPWPTYSRRCSMTFRLLETGVQPGAFNMGLDEAILNAVAEGRRPPTLRLYGWNPPAVTLGYFQGLEDEVDREACARMGVDIVRRVTGGGRSSTTRS